MRRVPIVSGSVRSAGYKDGILEIEFHDDSVYRFFAVPPEIAQAFLDSDSKGQYFVSFIRGRYSYERSADRETSLNPPET